MKRFAFFISAQFHCSGAGNGGKMKAASAITRFVDRVSIFALLGAFLTICIISAVAYTVLGYIGHGLKNYSESGWLHILPVELSSQPGTPTRCNRKTSSNSEEHVEVVQRIGSYNLPQFRQREAY
jgi:hypothetical protein